MQTGILQLYIENAQFYINNRAGPKSPSISRSEYELTLLTALDEGTLAIEFKLAWYNAILSTDMFDSFWYSQRLNHHLTEHQTWRYVPKPSLYSYDAPSPSSTSDAPPYPSSSKQHPPPKRAPKSQRSRASQTPYPTHELALATTDTASPDPYSRAAAKSGFEELRNMDLGPVEDVSGSGRKRKKTAKAVAMEGEEYGRKRKRSSVPSQMDGCGDDGVELDTVVGGNVGNEITGDRVDNVATLGSESAGRDRAISVATVGSVGSKSSSDLARALSACGDGY